MSVTADQDKLIVLKKARPSYTLAELDHSGAPEEKREWLAAPAAGREII